MIRHQIWTNYPHSFLDDKGENEKNDLRWLYTISSVFTGSNITIELMIASVNMFLARLRLIFKMSSEKGQKHIYALEHQFYYYYNNFRGHSQKESKTVQ